MTKQTLDKNFRCNICQRGFTRIDHLKRHHLRREYLFLCFFVSSCQVALEDDLTNRRFWREALFMHFL